MIVLPIVNRNRVMNVKISLKDAQKVQNGVILDHIQESDIIFNQYHYLDSNYQQENDGTMHFIRNMSLITNNDFLVTTREDTESNCYDVYQVKKPPKFVNPALDNLYADVITDMRKELPRVKRGRYLSLEKLGMGEYLTDSKIAILQQVIKSEPSRSRWPKLFQEAGIADLPLTIEFLNHFDCTIISDTTLPVDTLQTTIESLKPLNTQDYRDLKKHYDIAVSNQKIYSKLSLVNHLLYNQPYRLISSDKSRKQAKQKVKAPMEGIEYGTI